MNIKSSIFDKSIESLGDPKSQKNMTVGDLAQLAQVMESLARVKDKFQEKQPEQPNHLETRLHNLEERFTKLETRINAIYEAFTGVDYD